MTHFGSLSRALAAKTDELTVALPDDLETIRQIDAARRLVQHSSRDELGRVKLRVNEPSFRRYLQMTLVGFTVEKLHATFVDARQVYITDEIVAEGTISHLRSTTRHLLGRALALGASGIILAHNHPSGCAIPSSADIQATAQLAALCRSLDIVLMDHFIIGGPQVLSMKAEKYL